MDGRRINRQRIRKIVSQDQCILDGVNFTPRTTAMGCLNYSLPPDVGWHVQALSHRSGSVWRRRGLVWAIIALGVFLLIGM